ncbi:hypothetical protein CPB86DRAFT_818926 [Serendipita vermifera]|nr:hypothetical protein CPB86DRAFT_818926 [Serendipita vermifera]
MKSPDTSTPAVQAEPDNTRRGTYRVGVRFSSLENPSENSDKSAVSKQWTLVFTPARDPDVARTVEIFPNLAGKVAILDKEHISEVSSFPIAEYQGFPEDIERILEVHPARGLHYSPSYNNCQHFVAAFLILLQVFANDEFDRSFKILDASRMDSVLSVLGTEGLKLYNKPNMQLQFGAIRALSLSGWAAAGLTHAAEATVTYTVPASGIAGWFGATTSVVAPAAYASVAAAAAPVITAATVSAGATYFWHRTQWKKQSMFNNPRYHGFPKERGPPLTQADYMQREDMENKGQNKIFQKLLDSIPAPFGRVSEDPPEPPPAPQRS